ncbi:MAG: hypothetical protein NTX63_03250 [Candidatus Peregrinibacteria bacterium]|nr:hypothetical protein [Candidatus Peregrinibacteria bacterium]
MKKSFISSVAVVMLLAQITPVFAANETKPTATFFENAWKDADTTRSYGFTCKASSTSIKTKKGVTLTGDDKKQVDLVLSALKKFKRTDVGTLLGQKKQMYTSRESLNSLGILDSMSAGQLTLDEAIQKMKTAKKAKGEIVVDGNFVYYKGNAGWKVFEDADFANKLYSAAANDSLVSTLEKSSFVFKNYTNPGKSQPAIYQGTLTSDGTTTLLKPFLGEDTAKKQVNAPTSLVIAGDAHMQQYDVVAKVVLGGLSFTVKDQCTAKLKNATIKVPSNAATIDAATGKEELSKLIIDL